MAKNHFFGKKNPEILDSLQKKIRFKNAEIGWVKKSSVQKSPF